MLKQRARVLAGGLILADLAITAVSLLVAYPLRNQVLRAIWPSAFSGALYPFSRYLLLLALVLPVFALCLVSVGFYSSRRTLPLWEELWAAAKAVFLATATISLLESFSEDAWMRRGVVNGYEASVRGLAFHVAGHELHHLRTIRDKYLV